MITIVCGTDRSDSKTRLFVDFIYSILSEKGTEPLTIIDLAEPDWRYALGQSYDPSKMPSKLNDWQDQKIIPAQKFIFVLPEYNGSYPGVFKYFLDQLSVREIKASFKGKKAALLGISSGRSGNVRGLEDITGSLNYLGIIVMPLKQPISSIDHLVQDNKIVDKETIEVLTRFANSLVEF